MAKETVKKLQLTEGTLRALEALKVQEAPVTLADLNAGLDQAVGSAHLTSLVRNGFAESQEVEVEVVTVRKVKQYVLTDAGRNYVQE